MYALLSERTHLRSVLANFAVQFSIRKPIDVVSTKHCMKDSTRSVVECELPRRPEVVREEKPR